MEICASELSFAVSFSDMHWACSDAVDHREANTLDTTGSAVTATV